MKLKLYFPKKQPLEKEKKPRSKLHCFSEKQNRRRYRLHCKLRKINEICINARALQVDVPHDFDAESNRELKELCGVFGYNVQYTINQ